MNVCILMGSPRKNGNTAAILDPFIRALEARGVNPEVFRLYDRAIEPCTGCRSCQKEWTAFNCRIRDDVPPIADAILGSELLVFATPIYSWYCTAPMKALLDRLVYGMNKFYGETKGPSLWAGKKAALITTCGYRPEKGADLFEEGLRRYCKHSGLAYLGMLAERHLGYSTVFMSDDKAERAALFAGTLMDACLA